MSKGADPHDQWAELAQHAAAVKALLADGKIASPEVTAHLDAMGRLSSAIIAALPPVEQPPPPPPPPAAEPFDLETARAGMVDKLAKLGISAADAALSARALLPDIPTPPESPFVLAMNEVTRDILLTQAGGLAARHSVPITHALTVLERLLRPEDLVLMAPTFAAARAKLAEATAG